MAIYTTLEEVRVDRLGVVAIAHDAALLVIDTTVVVQVDGDSEVVLVLAIVYFYS